MKKVYSISLVIVVILILILSLMYFYAAYKTKQNYVEYFNKCKEELTNYIPNDEFGSSPQIKECFDAGGCYVHCGSGCGLPKPSITFLEMMLFYLDRGYGRICVSVCVPGCLYPID